MRIKYKPHYLLVGVSLAFACISPVCLARDKTGEATALFTRARQLADIRSNDSPGFVLKAEFKISRDPQHPVIGSYIETWSSPSLYRIEISAGPFHETEVVDARKRWELDLPSEMPTDINILVKLVAYQLDSRDLPPSLKSVAIQNRNNSVVSLRCVTTQSDGIASQEFCFDKSSGLLVVRTGEVFSAGRVFLDNCAYSDFGKVGGKSFPKSVDCLESRKESVHARITELSLLDGTNRTLFVPPAGAKEFSNCPVPLTAPEPVKRVDVTISKPGTSGVSFLVAADGTVQNPKVIVSGGPELDKAAVDAVSQWRFRPARCEGTPMEIPDVQVVFNIGKPI